MDSLAPPAPLTRYKPCACDCNFSPDEWPWSNADLRIGTCMRTCAYCGVTLSSAVKLRRHLTTSKLHAPQQFTVKAERGGRPSIASKNSHNTSSRAIVGTHTESFISAGNASSNSIPSHISDDIIEVSRGSTPRGRSIFNFDFANTPEPNSTPTSHVGAKNHTSSETHEEQIRRMESEGFDTRVVETFRSLKLSTIDNISPETRQLWIEHNGRIPSTLDARRCWTNERPTNEKLFTATVEHVLNSSSSSSPSAACSVIQRGERTGKKAMEAVSQLAFPNCWNPLTLVNLRLDILTDGMFAVPKDLVHSYEADNLQIMLTPKYAWTQLHFDNAEGLSSIIGKAGQKIFAIFPNSPHNTTLFRSTLSNEAKLEQIGPSLEGGVTVSITSVDAIDLPGNCFHAVWTLEGCFLATLDFTTLESVRFYPKIMVGGLDRFVADAQQGDLFEWFLTAFEIAWKHERVEDALVAWIAVFERVEEWAGRNQKWLKEAVAVCERFLSSRAAAGKRVCPCGVEGVGGTDSRNIFESVIL